MASIPVCSRDSAPGIRLESVYNIVHWTDMPRGGHFAAMEEPEAPVADIRAFARPLRQGSGGL